MVEKITQKIKKAVKVTVLIKEGWLLNWAEKLPDFVFT